MNVFFTILSENAKVNELLIFDHVCYPHQKDCVGVFLTRKVAQLA